MTSPGHDLLQHLRAAAVELLGALREPSVVQLLAGLGPPPVAWSGHGLDGQLLGRIDAAALRAVATHPGAASLVGRLGALIGESDTIGLFGREVAGRRVPVLAIQAGAGPGRLVALAGPRPDGQEGLEVVVTGSNPEPVDASPAPGVHVRVGGNAPNPFTVTMPASGPAGLTGAAPGAGVHVEVDLEPPAAAPAGDGPGLRRGGVHLLLDLRAGGPGPVVDVALSLPGITASVLPGVLAAVVPRAALPPIDLTVATHPVSGLVLQGDASLDVALPGTGRVGPLDVRALAVTLGAGTGAAGLELRFGLRADVAVSLPAAPVTLSALALEVGLVLGLTSGAPPALSAPSLGGLGVTLELPIASGGGVLRETPDGEWVGALALEIPPMAVAAYGIFRPPANGRSLSFLVVLSARFPPPGIQIGFGFAVSGVGGIFGVARRADLDALTGAVLDGSLGGLLFPSDPEREAPRIVSALPRLFPDAPGRILFGPMLELNWAGGLVKAQAAMILDLPDPARFVFVGRLVVDLPHADLALVHIEVRFMAAFDLGVPEFRLVASLTGSYVVGLTLSGDLFLLIRGGPSATFVLSAGGFHPAVRPPEGVPALKRIGMALSIPVVELRYESYLAVTTTSVQFGAKVELTASIAGCGVHGWLGFDALFEWVPRFRFSVSISAGLEVEVFGATLMGVRLEGLLEGPSPWHIRARGEVEVMFVSVSLTIDETFGDEPRAVERVPDVGAELERALADPSAWAVRPPDADRDGVLLSIQASAGVAAGAVLHPAGSLTVRQRLLPLGIDIDRLGGVAVPPQRWSLTGVQLRADQPPLPPTDVLRDQFALGTFRTLSADEQLATTAFSEQMAGARLSPDGIGRGDVRATELDWETIVVGPDLEVDRLDRSHLLELAELDLVPFLIDTTPTAARVWAPRAPVTVRAELPHTVATDAPVVGLIAGIEAPAFATMAEAVDAARARTLAGTPARVVEQWELA